MYTCSKCHTEFCDATDWCECADDKPEYLDDIGDKDLFKAELDALAVDAKRLYSPRATILVVVYEDDDNSCGDVVYNSEAVRDE